MGAVLSTLGVTVSIVCAAAAFVAHARPDAALGLVARVAGKGDLLDQGRLSQSDEEHLMAMVHGARCHSQAWSSGQHSSQGRLWPGGSAESHARFRLACFATNQ